MRLQRILTALVAVTLIGLTTVGLTGSAQAVPATDRAGSVGAHARDLPKRDLNDRVVKNSKHWLIFKGNVDPGWNHKIVKVYKRLTKDGPFSLFKKVETDVAGRWSVRIYAPRDGYWYWKGVVPKAGGYGKSTTDIWRTFTV
jgi:hypothetical protein